MDQADEEPEGKREQKKERERDGLGTEMAIMFVFYAFRPFFGDAHVHDISPQ